MAAIVQLGTQFALTTDPDTFGLTGVTSGHQVFVLLELNGTSVTVDSITDNFGSTWVRKDIDGHSQYISSGGVLECWTASMAGTGDLTGTINFTGTPSGGGAVVEVSFVSAMSDGPSDTLDATTASNPLFTAPLTTAQAGIIFSWTRVTSNFGVSSYLDGFAAAATGAQLGRTFAMYRITSGAASVAPGATMSSAESADSATIAFYDGTEIRGSFGFGSDLRVTATKAIAFSVDGNTNTHSTSGEVKVFGDFEVTGDTEVVNLTATGTTTLASNSISYAEMQDVSAASRLLGRGSAAGAGDPQEISLGSGLTMSGTTLSASSGVATRTITFVLDGGGSVLTTGVKNAAVRLDVAATITSWTLMSDQSGSIEVDVLRDTFANYPPTGADSIVNAHYPALSSADSAEDTDVSDWSDVTLDAGDVLKIDVRSVSTLTYAVLQLTVTV